MTVSNHIEESIITNTPVEQKSRINLDVEEHRSGVPIRPHKMLIIAARVFPPFLVLPSRAAVADIVIPRLVTEINFDRPELRLQEPKTASVASEGLALREHERATGGEMGGEA